LTTNIEPIESIETIKIPKKKIKAESKRFITSRELEIFFREKTSLTYRGYVIKFGQEAFLKRKHKVYCQLHYQKIKKQELANKKETETLF
jgi:hypothetical protein